MGGMSKMTKKFIRNTMIGFCVFIAVIIITYVAVTYLYKASAAKTAAPLTEDDVTDCEYYLARFNGKGISIFACSNGNEEFLYTIDVRAEDISTDELTKLKEGIILSDKQALASFEEDFAG